MEKPDSIRIRDFVKPGKFIVVELDDEVEYILPGESISGIEAGKRIVTAIRVVDRKAERVSVRRIMWAIARGGVVDYLDRI